MRRLFLIVAALIALAALIPGQAHAFKPEIVYVRATADNEGVRFSAKVRMDKRSPNNRKVSVTYDGERKRARPLDDPPLSFYESDPFASAPVRDCYRVTVRATNRFGTTTRTLKADRIGTNGCD
ncbi:MAG: hypothetical protein M3331_03425 [Actinomycetota bacterium]|nr:hypothetical protein [Actinomycetota bacterium]